MKKILCAALMLSLLFTMLPCSVFATTDGIVETIRMDDGSYMVISVVTSPVRAGNTVSGSKVCTFYDSDHNAEWEAVLTASYVFTGGSYTCTSASCNVSIYANQWYVVSKSTNYAGNRATANLTMGKRVVGITTEKPKYIINMYCDINGNLS